MKRDPFILARGMPAARAEGEQRRDAFISAPEKQESGRWTNAREGAAAHSTRGPGAVVHGGAPVLNLPVHVAQSGFDHAPEMAVALAEHVAELLRDALARRPRASLVVSGGRSPQAFLWALSHCRLDWARVSVTLADERWVPPRHADSNEGLVRHCLLRGPAAAARVVPLYGGEPTPEAGLAACAARLAAVPRPFDAVVLGMGEDGHFASLFPGIEGLAGLLATERTPGALPVVAVDPPHAPHPRLTLSLAELLGARCVLLQIQGPRKAAVIERAAADGDGLRLPVAALLHQTRTPVHVFFGPSE